MSTLKVTNIKSANGTSALSIADSSGNVELKTTSANLILPSGGGISFQNHSTSTATGASSTTSDNVLDDYEEGTCSLSGTNWGSTTGNYTKIGNSVRVDAVATMTGTLGITDDISGLPFVPSGYHSSTISVRDNSSALRTILCANVAFIGSTTRITSITGLSAPTTNDQLMISIIYRTT